MLARRVGVQHIELVEDAVQSALMAALTAWSEQGRPDDPGAWLYRVAYNRVIQDLRRTSGRKILERSAADLVDAPTGRSGVRRRDPRRHAADALRLLRRGHPWESRLVLALKTLCGFSTAEIALRLFTSEANVYKRLARARAAAPDPARRGDAAAGDAPLAAARGARRALSPVQRGISVGPRRTGDPARAVRRGGEAGDTAGRPSRRCGSGQLRPARAHASARRPAGIARRRDGRAAAPRGTGPLAVGSRADPARHAVAGAVGRRRRLLSVSCGGGHRRRALHRAVVRGDAVARESPTSTQSSSASRRHPCTP